MIRAEFDHLVVAASSLEIGSEYVSDLLGADLVAGGRHREEGTHNRLLRLGDKMYLEVISIDPEANSPSSRRWFSLDTLNTKARLHERPALIAWVARTDSIANLITVSPYENCKVIQRERDGLRWQFSCTPSGMLLGDGLLPLMIQWDGVAHPTDFLPDVGCRLHTLKGISKDPEQIRSTLSILCLLDSLQLVEELPEGCSLEAEIETPRGHVVLR